MGKKAVEERKRRMEGKGDKASRAGSPSEPAKEQASPCGKWGAHGEGRGRKTLGLAGMGEGGWVRAGLGWAGVLLQPAGAEAVYLVSH
jgi:hypothetical protein